MNTRLKIKVVTFVITSFVAGVITGTHLTNKPIKGTSLKTFVYIPDSAYLLKFADSMIKENNEAIAKNGWIEASQGAIRKK